VNFVADVNIEKLIVDTLRKQGHDVKWITEVNMCMTDAEILKISSDEKRILLTNDKDFGEIVFRQKMKTSGVILFRVKEQDEDLKLHLMLQLLKNHGDKIENHFIVLAKDKFRIIKL
jgi:predicted nuclease of predicted toxin-antitoxin system